MRPIQEIQSDIKKHQDNILRETLRQQAAQKQRAGSFILDSQGRKTFSGFFGSGAQAIINSTATNIRRSRKLIEGFKAELSQHQTGVTTQTSQFVLGSTIGSASSLALTQRPALDPTSFFNISSGNNMLKDNRFTGTVRIVLNTSGIPGEELEANVKAFLITNLFDGNGANRFVHKVNQLNFTAIERDETINIDERGNNLNDIFYQQFVVLDQRLDIRDRASNVQTNTVKSQTIPPTQPPFLPPIPQPPIDPTPPPMIPPDEPPIEEERDLFNTAIIGAIGIGILASLMGDKKK